MLGKDRSFKNSNCKLRKKSRLCQQNNGRSLKDFKHGSYVTKFAFLKNVPGFQSLKLFREKEG